MSSGDTWREWSSFGLAYLGDAVFEIWCRKYALQRSQSARQVHKWVVGLVRCQTQSKLASLWYELLSDEEQQVFRRGRNQKPQTRPKHATVEEYRLATGFECVVGYWHLQQQDRLNEMMNLQMSRKLIDAHTVRSSL
jgi:ribonuclease-3 family protein